MHSLVVTAGNTMYNLRDGLTFDPQVFGLNTSLFGESFSTLWMVELDLAVTLTFLTPAQVTVVILKDRLKFDPQALGLNTSLFGESFTTLFGLDINLVVTLTPLILLW